MHGPCEVPPLQGRNQDSQAPNCSHPVASAPSSLFSFLHLYCFQLQFHFRPPPTALLSTCSQHRSQDASPRGSAQHQGDLGAQPQCFLSGLLVGSQEQGSVGATAITSPDAWLASALYSCLIILRMGQVPLSWLCSAHLGSSRRGVNLYPGTKFPHFCSVAAIWEPVMAPGQLWLQL